MPEKLLLQDASGKSYPLPYSAWVRAQGKVVLMRDPNARPGSKSLVRWRYVDTIFASYSRKTGKR